MDKHGGSVTFILFLFTIFLIIVGDEAQHSMEEQQRNPTFPEKITSMFFSSTTSSAATTSYWEKAKILVKQAHAHFFPPNLDFKGSDEGVGGGGGGAEEKVKEAVAMSLEKSKATVDDSAKTAAKLAGETMHKTAEKVKKSLYEREGDHKAEL